MAGSPEDPSKRFIEELREIPATHWNITGMNAASVISILKSIVNDREKFKDEAKFTFDIKGDKETISFTLEANPNDKQPGNGIIRRSRNPRGGGDKHRSYDKDLIEVLTQRYCCTEKLAQDIRRVFKNNSELFKCGNEIIQDVYILLLFEIGRRLVDDENVAEEHRTDKQAYDNLPISEAITKIVKLFEAKKCSFEDFFDEKGRFHCFTGSPDVRKFAVNKLKSSEKYEDIEALFYGEKSSKDAASGSEECSKDPTRESEKSSKDAASGSEECSKDPTRESEKSSKDAASGGEECSKDPTRESEKSSKDAASGSEECSKDPTRESEKSSKDAASGSEECSKDPTRESEKSSKDAASGGEECSKDPTRESEKSSEDAGCTSESEESSEDAASGSEESSEEEFPIKEAITTIVKLFGAKKCSSKDFFLKMFHCFTGTPKQRKKAMKKLKLKGKYDDASSGSEESSEDEFPIKEAITTIVKLFGEEKGSSKDFFLKMFHCFTGTPKQRKKAMKKLKLKEKYDDASSGSEESSEDEFPINEAITTIVKLFGAKKCSSEDFFLKMFHCFTGTPKQRKNAIKKLKLKEQYDDASSGSEESSKDEFPIKEAITTIVKLFGAKKCSSEDFFLKMFHCFTGTPKQRKKAMKKLKLKGKYDDASSGSEESSEDEFPINEAITTIVKLFGAKKCSSEDFFLKMFHCFKGTPKQRKNAMKKLKLKGKYDDASSGSEESSEDEFPINEAITTSVKLFGAKGCSFEDSFPKMFHCLTGTPKQGKNAIKKLKLKELYDDSSSGSEESSEDTTSGSEESSD